MTRRRMHLFAVVIVAGLASLNVWAWLVLTEAKDGAARASQDAQVCRQLAAAIVRLRTRPTVAGNKEQAEQALSQRIESAARACNINGDDLAAIDPEPPVRVAETAYLEKPTTVQLRTVTLAQLIDFLCGLSGDGKELRVKTLRLTTPHSKEDGNRWSVELTLTYLIYSPEPRETGKGEM